jgi:hypothetical protein
MLVRGYDVDKKLPTLGAGLGVADAGTGECLQERVEDK